MRSFSPIGDTDIVVNYIVVVNFIFNSVVELIFASLLATI